MKDPLVEAAEWALMHFVQLDEANAAIHCAPVRYSPITFRLAKALYNNYTETATVKPEIIRVMNHVGLYEEDGGR